MAVRSVDVQDTSAAQLQSFIEKYDPEDQKLIRSVRSAVRRRLPAANELVYEYSTNLVIGYSPTDRPTDGILAIGLRADGVRLYFMRGKKLPDPKKLLMGSGRQTRFIQVQTARQLKHPDVEALIAAGIGQATVPLPSKGRGKLVIRSTAAKKQRRRKPAR